MQPELLQSSFNRNSSFDEFREFGLVIDYTMDHYEFSPPFTMTEDSSDNSINSLFPTVFPDEFINVPFLAEEMNFTLPENDFSDFVIEDLSQSPEESERSFLSHQLSMDGDDEWSLSSPIDSSNTSVLDMSLVQASLTLPSDEMDLDNQLILFHLVKAYREAMDREERELAGVIMKHIGERVSPVGGVIERLLYYLHQSLDKQGGYVKEESSINFRAAFKAFYQIFPYGKFAHFAANLEILKAMPDDVEVIHIIDFDMGEGIQWSSLIEAIGCQQREIRLTSIKGSGGDYDLWRFEETKEWLCDHALSLGLKLTVDSMELHDLVSEIKKMKKKGGRREWLAFNCMIGLPHMGRVRSKRDVSVFLGAAKELLGYTANCDFNNMGIINLGGGDAWVQSKSYSSLGSFLEGHLAHYQALLESMEWTFPIHLGEARTAMECLFVAPLISSFSWEEMACCDLHSGFGLEGWKVSEEGLMEAKEMVRERENPYGVRIEGESDNSMVLRWREIPLVRVSCWRS